MADKTEFLTTSSFWFECPKLDGKRAISEISGLSITVKAAAGQETVAVMTKGASMRQAKPTGPATYEEITVKVVATGQDDLYQWFIKTNPPNQGEKSEWDMKGINATVKSYNAANEETAIWEIEACYPTKYGGPSFKAGDGGLAYEEFKLTHNRVRRTK
ncbi:phage tail protein [Microcoleus sp. FACHB-831]|uniref:phage tail protein n=1 Tax=Microcoleus sp. FACHB-831 TaxID=2692827 RepID=UPI001689115E|nr:phage tail protein [Microcoleus sp. FACHB-831]MBD1924307.1 phage tail protein [Microcoleus sp. FACHB-831]